MTRTVLLCLLYLSGCTTLYERHVQSVAQRASYDFQCTPHEIDIYDVGGNAFAAQGCGHRQVYNCSGTSETCVPEGLRLPPEDPPPLYVPPYSPPGAVR